MIARPRYDLDLGHLLNERDPLNRGLIGWYLAMPLRDRGFTWSNLAQSNGATGKGTLTNFTPAGASSGWGGSLRGRVGFGRLNFDGSDDYVDCGDVFGGLSAMTISAFIFVKVAPNVSGLLPFNIIAKANDNNTFAGTAFNFYYDGSFHCVLGGPNQTVSTGAIGINSLVHLTMTYDGTTMLMYSAGVQAASQAASGTINALTGTSTRFGQSASIAFNGFFNGWLDDVRIYNRALSAAEVFGIYNASTTGYQGQLRRSESRYIVDAPSAPTAGTEFATWMREHRPPVTRHCVPCQAAIDPVALTVPNPELSAERFVSGDYLRLMRDLHARPRGRFWNEPLQGATDPDGMTLENRSAERFVSGDYLRLMRDLYARPRGRFWDEPLQGATDPDGLTVANPEQEQSKFVTFEPSTRGAPFLRWLNGRFWQEPMQGRIDPRALMLIDAIDATMSQQDMQTVLPHAAFWASDRRRQISSTFGQLDAVSMALAEIISADKFWNPWQARLLPRPPVTFTYGDAILEATLIPEDPPSLFMRSWYAPLSEPVRLPLARWTRHRFPVGTLDLDESQRPETIYVQAFEAPLRLPRWARAIRGHFFPTGDLGIDNADRAERISVDEFRRLFQEPLRARARILAGQVAVGQLLVDPAAAAETVFADKYHRPFDVPRGKAQLWRGLMQIAVSEYDDATFSQPFLVKFIRSMLNAGF